MTAPWGIAGARLRRSACAASGQREPGSWWLPWPLAVVLTLIMPWRAVAALRSADRVQGELLDFLVRQHRQRGECAPTRPERHLRLVR